MGCGKSFSDHREPVTRELGAYREDWEKYLMNKITKELVLASWKNMVDYPFMILILIKDIPLMIKHLLCKGR